MAGRAHHWATVLMAAGHGGQTLICRVTQELVRDKLPPDVWDYPTP